MANSSERKVKKQKKITSAKVITKDKPTRKTAPKPITTPSKVKRSKRKNSISSECTTPTSNSKSNSSSKRKSLSSILSSIPPAADELEHDASCIVHWLTQHDLKDAINSLTTELKAKKTD
mmetsp:Transcript_32708/g.39747  ORF Transcript_32708/g.39747 Transcript_32708/m.39747 type:complete len:120 (-) Transcript_32708:10-369(-)